MIWHICKKDIRLLYHWIVIAFLVRASMTVFRFVSSTQYVSSSAQMDGSPAPVMQILALAHGVVWAYLVAALVWQDRVPGFRQDWLVRPIPRMDLLGAKVLFVSLLYGVWFPLEVLDGIALGHSLRESLIFALLSGGRVFLSATLPFLAFACMWDNQFAMAAAAGFVLLSIMLPSTNAQLSNLGLVWMTQEVVSLIILAASVVILVWMYRQRRAKSSRALMIAAICVCYLVTHTPLSLAFAIQERLSPNPDAGRQVRIEYAGAILTQVPAAQVPLRVTGIPEDRQLHVDLAQTWLRGGRNATMDFQQPHMERQGDVWVLQQPLLPVMSFLATPDGFITQQGGTVEYHLTMMRLAARITMPAFNGDESLPGIGRCFSRWWRTDTVYFGCADRQQMPTCFSLSLETIPGVDRTTPSLYCRPDYGPLDARLFNSNFTPVPAELRFTGSPDPDMRLVLRIYEAEDHFTRRVTIPDLKTKVNLPVLDPDEIKARAKRARDRVTYK